MTSARLRLLVIALLVYAACVVGAFTLAPEGTDRTQLLAYTFVVWLGGVMFLVLARAVDNLKNADADTD